ncbi:hypothetical protein Barb4_02659 [Bacteroidales bacterium Barb4]|nr:hypothetical protein Barb4_02659 [Bacteroidales bacterium Barb4]
MGMVKRYVEILYPFRMPLMEFTPNRVPNPVRGSSKHKLKSNGTIDRN